MKTFFNPAISIFFALFLLLSACSLIGNEKKSAKQVLDDLTKSNFNLTDDMVQKYIKAYKVLKEKGGDLIQGVNTNNAESMGKDKFNTLESAIKSAGFNDYAEFVRVNAKIAWAFSLSQGSGFVDKMETTKSEGFKQIEDALNDPLTPEETKKELRKAKEEIQKEWDKNKQWSDLTLNQIKKITSNEDMAIIKKYSKELEEAFSGVTLPKPE